MDLDAGAAEWEILCHQCINIKTLLEVMEKLSSYRNFYLGKTDYVDLQLQLQLLQH